MIRWGLAIGVLLVGVVVLSYLQGRFDQADLKKAVQAVQVKFPDAVDCRAEMVSRFRGRVQVRCGDQQWLVDVIKGVIGENDGH